MFKIEAVCDKCVQNIKNSHTDDKARSQPILRHGMWSCLLSFSTWPIPKTQSQTNVLTAIHCGAKTGASVLLYFYLIENDKYLCLDLIHGLTLEPSLLSKSCAHVVLSCLLDTANLKEGGGAGTSPALEWRHGRLGEKEVVEGWKEVVEEWKEKEGTVI